MTDIDALPNGCCHPPADHARHVAHSADIPVARMLSLLDEYAATVNPAPYTTERALYERMRAIVDEVSP